MDVRSGDGWIKMKVHQSFLLESNLFFSRCDMMSHAFIIGRNLFQKFSDGRGVFAYVKL